MRTVPLVTYVVAGSDVREPAADLVHRMSPLLSAHGPIHLCRELADDTLPSEVPAGPIRQDDSGRRVVEEAWTASPTWLGRALESNLESTLADRLVIRVSWPPTAEAEESLLLARLTLPSLRIAVELEDGQAEETFGYFNRLGFSWIAVPATVDSYWSSAMTALARRWCIDRRTQTCVEPIVSAFGLAMRRRLAGEETAPWLYRVINAGTGFAGPSCGWSPSVHAALLGYPSKAFVLPLEYLSQLDAEWTMVVSEICDRIDLSQRSDSPFATPRLVPQGATQ